MAIADGLGRPRADPNPDGKCRSSQSQRLWGEFTNRIKLFRCIAHGNAVVSAAAEQALYSPCSRRSSASNSATCDSAVSARRSAARRPSRSRATRDSAASARERSSSARSRSSSRLSSQLPATGSQNRRSSSLHQMSRFSTPLCDDTLPSGSCRSSIRRYSPYRRTSEADQYPCSRDSAQR